MTQVKKFLATPFGQSLIHAVKIAGFLAVTAFLTSLAGFLAKDPGVTGYVATHPYGALIFAAINMFLAGLIKYTQVR